MISKEMHDVVLENKGVSHLYFFLIYLNDSKHF